MSEYEYRAEITGHEPPFKWAVIRRGPGTQPRNPKGEANSVREAIDAAEEAAREMEWDRRHAHTHEDVLLFTSTDPPEPTTTADLGMDQA